MGKDSAFRSFLVVFAAKGRFERTVLAESFYYRLLLAAGRENRKGPVGLNDLSPDPAGVCTISDRLPVYLRSAVDQSVVLKRSDDFFRNLVGIIRPNDKAAFAVNDPLIGTRGTGLNRK